MNKILSITEKVNVYTYVGTDNNISICSISTIDDEFISKINEVINAVNYLIDQNNSKHTMDSNNIIQDPVNDLKHKDPDAIETGMTSLIFLPVCKKCGYVFNDITLNSTTIEPKVCPNCNRVIENAEIINVERNIASTGNITIENGEYVVHE